LVIDKSGSMREANRILYAQEAAKAVARQLKDNDFLGIVGFDSSAFVLVPLEPVGKLRRVIDAQIDRLKPGGQTYFYPALMEAKRQIEGQRFAIILISDGETRAARRVGSVGREERGRLPSQPSPLVSRYPDHETISQYGGGCFTRSTLLSPDRPAAASGHHQG
jgi:uncharacterized protein with von Willebrand factor type A (vWA) domain